MIGQGAAKQKIKLLFFALVLCLVAFVFQAFYAAHVIHLYSHPTQIARPPFDYQTTAVIDNVRDEAETAGVRLGDRLLKVNAVPFTGAQVLNQALQRSRPGDLIRVSVRHTTGELDERVIRLAPFGKAPYSREDWLFAIIALLLVPAMSLILGIGLVLAKPMDQRAWLTLALMMSFSQIYYVPGWEGPLPSVALAYRSFAAATFGIWLVLFAIHFPQRADWDMKRPWLKWLFILPVIAFTIASVTNEVCAQKYIDEIAPWQAFLAQLHTIQTILRLLAIIVFFTITAVAARRATTPDGRRRIATLWKGAALSLGPMFALVVVGLLFGQSPLAIVPSWVSLPSVLLLDVLPCTLIYVILVRRALSTSGLLRQGTRQAGQRGIALLRLIAVASIGAVLVDVLNHPKPQLSLLTKIVLFLSFIYLVFEQTFAGPVNRWVDRRLFGAALNPEQVLVSLNNITLRDVVLAGTKPLLTAIADALSSAFHISRVAIFLPDGNEYKVQQVLDGGDPATIPAFKNNAAVVRHLLTFNNPEFVYFDDDQSWLHACDVQERAALRALDCELLVPLVKSGQLLGIIGLGAKSSQEPYSNNDLDLLRLVAVQASLALENSNLVSTLSAEIAERERKNAEKEAAERANKVKSDFLARMSHELRTPLNAIIGYSEMLLEEVQDSGQPGFAADLSKIRIAGKHLLELINAVLDISKIEAGKMELYLEQFSVHKIITDTLAILEPVVAKKGNRLRTDIPSDLGTMTADLVKIRQVLFNLLSNAAKFTENGLITLAVRAQKRETADWVCFSVTDTGVGMTPEQLARLFMPFSQADSSVTSKYGGTGLGLAISRHFCQMMGGDIKVESAVGQGTTFTAEIPRNVRQPDETIDKAQITNLPTIDGEVVHA